MDRQYSHMPLTPHSTNLPQTPKQHKKRKDDRLMLAVEQEINNNEACDLLGIIMADPQLKQLNTSLQKQAQEKKKSKLLQSFPLRYNSLVQTEVLYKQLQLQLKQQKMMQTQLIQKYTNKMTNLKQMVQQLQDQLQNKNQQIKIIGQKHAEQLESAQMQRRKDIDNKNKQLLIKDSLYTELEKKFIKLKSDKDHTTQYIEQLKEECDVLRNQNDRIVINLTQKEIQIQQLQETISRNDLDHQVEVQSLLYQINQIQNKFAIRFSQKSQEYSEIEQTLHNANAALQNCEVQLRQAETQKCEMQIQAERINEQKDAEIVMAREEINVLKDSLQKRQQNILAIQIEYRQQITQLNNEMYQQEIAMQQMRSSQQLELVQLHQKIKQLQTNHQRDKTQTQIKIIQLQQNKLQLQQIISQITNEKQSTTKLLQTSITQHEQLQAQLRHAHITDQKHQQKHRDIQKLIGQFKKQLENYNAIINQKEEKIQSYRKEILCLRRQAKQMAIGTQQMLAQTHNTEQHILQLVEQNQQLQLQLKRCNFQLEDQQKQIEQFNIMVNKQVISVATQTEIDDSQIQTQIQIDSLMKQLQKAQLKYHNVIEELNQYKRQFQEELNKKEALIAQLEHQNTSIRTADNGRIDDNKSVESLIDIKITQLKHFYEQKLQQEGTKYRKIIETLKTEMTELYNDIDLKKSIQDEMFQQIMQINSQRRTKTASH